MAIPEIGSDPVSNTPWWKRWWVRLMLRVRKALINLQYDYMNRLDFGGNDLTFLNYGFAILDGSPAPELDEENEPNRVSIQLYHHLLAQVDVADKDVVEIGCGRGGGAAYAAKQFAPKSMLGVDLCRSTIQYCRARHRAPNLRFTEGDAEALPLEDEQFDIVLNVESSHCYGNLAKFVSEVYRVLRPGGYFLLTDFRRHSAIEVFEQRLLSVPFETVYGKDITENVVAALEQDSDRKVALIEESVPERRRNHFKNFAAVKGSALFNEFAEGDLRYLAYVLRKPSLDEDRVE